MNVNDTSTPTTTSKKTTAKNIPRADADFLTLAKTVSAKWKATPALTLLWINQATYKTLVDDYDTHFNNRLAIGSNRSTNTQTLAQINREIDNAVESVKAYIIKKYKKANAVAQYGRYGIVKQNGNYRLPKDNDKRTAALPLMADAIKADGFTKEEFGSSFWTTIIKNFTTALNNSLTTTQNISNKVAAKTNVREKIHKVLIAIIQLINANYPDTSAKVLREWGFIKQNF